MRKCGSARTQNALCTIRLVDARITTLATEVAMTVTQMVLLVMGLVVAYWAVRVVMGGRPRG